MGQGSPKDLVKAHENIELENGQRMPKENKWAKDAQRGKKWDKDAHKQCNGSRKPKVA